MKSDFFHSLDCPSNFLRNFPLSPAWGRPGERPRASSPHPSNRNDKIDYFAGIFCWHFPHLRLFGDIWFLSHYDVKNVSFLLLVYLLFNSGALFLKQLFFYFFSRIKRSSWHSIEFDGNFAIFLAFTIMCKMLIFSQCALNNLKCSVGRIAD